MSPKAIVDPREWNIPMGLVVVIVFAAVAVTGTVLSIKSDLASLREDVSGMRVMMATDFVSVRKFESWATKTEKANKGAWICAEYPEGRNE